MYPATSVYYHYEVLYIKFTGQSPLLISPDAKITVPINIPSRDWELNGRVRVSIRDNYGNVLSTVSSYLINLKVDWNCEIMVPSMIAPVVPVQIEKL